MKPAFFVVYAAGLGLNITFTRAYATHAGPGMAAALDYCMRGVGVPLALLVNPISNSLLPEIARLRSLFRLREALAPDRQDHRADRAGGGGRMRFRPASSASRRSRCSSSTAVSPPIPPAWWRPLFWRWDPA